MIDKIDNDHQKHNINKLNQYIKKQVFIDNLEITIRNKMKTIFNETENLNKQMDSIIQMYYTIMKNTKT
jgi:exonuclease I